MPHLSRSKTKFDKKHELPFSKGIVDGIAVCLGYIPISFAFGMLAAKSGLPIWLPIAISATNLTSAGQFAGLSVILASGGLVELAVTTFVINIRYILMSLALSQRVSVKMTTVERCIVAFGNTDEVFAIAMQQKAPLSTSYMLGLIAMPFLGWSFGTILGAVAANILPLAIQSALGITIYAMFIAIILPPAISAVPVLISVLLAAAVACVISVLPVLSSLSGGWRVIIAAVLAAAFCAYRFPIDDDYQNDEEGLTAREVEPI